MIDFSSYCAVLFVGQHAMAGTVFAPLNHTYSSRTVAYYRLNDVFIGEFGMRALLAGLQGTPTIFLAGDDKVAMEARMFIPQIETVAVKQGTGTESAIHMKEDAACNKIREGTKQAVSRMDEIPAFAGIAGPYTLEIRYLEPKKDKKEGGDRVEWVDERTERITKEKLVDLHP